MRYTTVLFDLDGTLSDSAEVITDALRRTRTHFGGDVPDDHALRRAVGPPIVESLRRFIGEDERTIAAALEHCRAVYAERMTVAPLFPVSAR